MRSLALSKLVYLTLVGTLVAGCGGQTIQRIDPDMTTDVSGNWNDTDSRLVSEEMTSDVLARPWLARYQTANDEARPTIIVGLVRNRSSEHIATETFTKDIERSFVNSGQVRVVSSSSEREGIRDERADQQDYSSPATVKKFGLERGADFMLLGTINSIIDAKGKDTVKYYQIDLELHDIQTNEKVWFGTKKIKKYIGKGKYKA
jgi:penicillin-binding protein activator